MKRCSVILPAQSSLPTVLPSTFYRKNGDYFVRTDGPDGKLHDYPIKYTFGWAPLQQYLIEFPGGRLQCLGIAWDNRPAEQGGRRWFHLYPDEKIDHKNRLHWTGRDQNWNYQCAECHSTDLQKHYNLETDSFKTTWAEIDVACEACHGPGARHVALAKGQSGGQTATRDSGTGLLVDLKDRDGGAWIIDSGTGVPSRRSVPRTSHTKIEMCARCHSRRGQIHAEYSHGNTLGNTHRLSRLEEPLYHSDGQIKEEVYVYGSFIQSSMYRAGVTCTDCHDAHSLRLKAEGNLLCAQCHQAQRYDTVDHHRHPIGSAGATCIACHMPQQAYMVIDDRADHSIRVPRPDLSLKLGTPQRLQPMPPGQIDSVGGRSDEKVVWQCIEQTAAFWARRCMPDAREHWGPVNSCWPFPLIWTSPALPVQARSIFSIAMRPHRI